MIYLTILLELFMSEHLETILDSEVRDFAFIILKGVLDSAFHESKSFGQAMNALMRGDGSINKIIFAEGHTM